MAKRSFSIAKITRPVIKGCYKRKRLFSLLDQYKDYPVIWVSGPAGSGKTTLVSDYIETKKLPCLWYRLDEGDADLATYFYYMGLAGKKAAPRKRKPLPLLTPEYIPGINTFSKRYFENLYSRLKIPTVVVLDNYQEVPDNPIFHSVIENAISVIPEGITVVILSRNDPPAELARLRAGNTVKIVGWEELRLTLEETEGVMELSDANDLPEDLIRKFQEKTRGWVAGMVLLLQRAKSEDMLPMLKEVHTPREIFDYFAGEIFERADDSVKEFLLKTAILQDIHPEAAKELTGIEKAGRMLSNLHSSHFFTERRFTRSDAVYRYHPLFREFLRAKAEEYFDDAELHQMQEKAANLLEDSGLIEGAAELYMRAGNLERLIPLILMHAQSLVMQGRNQTLWKWVSGIPEEVREKTPWLLFWMGTARLTYSTQEARGFLERAYYLFKEENDVAGLFLSWAGIADTFFMGLDDMTLLEGWGREMEEIIESGISFPSKEIEERVTCSMFLSLMMRMPHHKKMNWWFERVSYLIDNSSDINQSLRIGGPLVVYMLWMGELSQAARIINRLELIVNSSEANPFSKLNYIVSRIVYEWHMDNEEACNSTYEQGMRIARTSGVHILDHLLMLHLVYGLLTSGDLIHAEKLLQKLKPIMRGKFNLGNYHYLSGWWLELVGESEKAIEDFKISLELVTECCTPYPAALCKVELATLLVEKGEYKKTETLLEEVLTFAEKMGSSFLKMRGLLTNSTLAFIKKNENEEKESLGKALSIGRAKGLFIFPGWYPHVMAKHCKRALELGIETEYVKDLIRKRDLIPAESPMHIEDWPWAVKIYTLGRFGLEINGHKFSSKGKAQKKPLEMLKALLALGGRDVRVEQLSDALWPDADGDMAGQSFKITLHRLRKIIKNENAVSITDGRITLDNRYCWVDAWAYERCVKDAEAEWNGKDRSHAIELSEKSIEMYRGHFLRDEDRAGWAVSMRERLRSKSIRQIVRLGKSLEETGEYEKAVECYQKALETDRYSEDYYQALMKCYHRLNRKADALAVYARCEKTLMSIFGIEPSEETKRIYEGMRR